MVRSSGIRAENLLSHLQVLWDRDAVQAVQERVKWLHFSPALKHWDRERCEGESETGPDPAYPMPSLG